MKGTTNSMGLADGFVTRTKLARDALYSPITGISTNYTITSADSGKTLAAWTAACDFNIDNAGFSEGEEVAIIRYTYTADHIVNVYAPADGRFYLLNHGADAYSRFRISNIMGMVVLKKVEAATWLVIGDVEVF